MQFFGIDLRSNDLIRRPGFSSEGTKNVNHSLNSELTTRFGCKVLDADGSPLGLHVHETTDLEGNTKTEILGVNPSTGQLMKLVKDTFVITNNHATLSALITFGFEETPSPNFYFRVSHNGVFDVNEDVGLGISGVSLTLATLITRINTNSSHTAASSPAILSAAGVNAAFIELVNNVTIAAAGTLSINLYAWDNVPLPNASPFTTYFNNLLKLGSDDCRNASFVSLNGICYIASPYDASASAPDRRLVKYDGQKAYSAGMPALDEQRGAGLTTTAQASPHAQTTSTRGDFTITSAAGITGDTYKLRLVQIDKTGQRIEGPVYTQTGSPGGNIVAIASAHASHIPAGFNNDYARVGATTTSTTIPVTNSGLIVGDIAYFFDKGQGRNIQRKVTAASGVSITLSTTSLDTDENSPNYDSGATPQVWIDCLITANLRLAIYRNIAAGGTDFYLVEEAAPFFITGALAYAWFDYTSDADIEATGIALIEDKYPHNAPPMNCSMVSVYNDGLILSGDYLDPCKIYFSDVDGPEYFPKGTHEFVLQAKSTGHRESGGTLVLGTPRQLYGTSGILSDFAFRVEKIGEAIGVVAHETMREFEEGVMGFLSYGGPYVLYGGRRLEPMGFIEDAEGQKASRIAPFFTKNYPVTSERPRFERAVAAVLPEDKLYVMCVPYEVPTRVGFSTSETCWWVYDFGRDAWWFWKDVDGSGGIIALNNTLYFSKRGHNGGGGATKTNLVTYIYQQQRAAGTYNYVDHATAITAVHRSHWESLGQPHMFKRFLRWLISSVGTRESSTMPMAIKTYVDRDLTKLSFSDTITFTTQKDLRPKIKGETCKAMLFEISSSAYKAPLLIAGSELEAVAGFKPELKE